MTSHKNRLVLVAILLAGASAFAQPSATTTDPDPGKNTNTSNNAPVANATVAQLTDAQVTHILITANDGEIDAAKLAVKTSSRKEVKEFANMMISEHKENQKQTKDLAKKVKIKSKDNDISKNLKKSSKDTIAMLKKLKGNEFDKAYMTNQVGMHERVLNELESKLVPAAKNPELKAHLEMTKTHVESHLSKARDLEIIVSK